MLCKNAVRGQYAPVAGFGIYFGKLRYVIRVIDPALGVGIPIRTGEQSFVFEEKGIHQPREALHLFFGMKLRILPIGVQLPLLHGVLHGKSAPVFCFNIFQSYIS